MTAITAYAWALAVCIILFLLALLISNLVPYTPSGRDRLTRRVVFWVFCALTPCVSFAINAIVAQSFRIHAQRAAFMGQSAIAAGCALLLFILVGLVLSRAYQRSKISSWF